MSALPMIFFVLVAVPVIGIPAVTLAAVSRGARTADAPRRAVVTMLVLSSLGLTVWLAAIWWVAASGTFSRATLLVPIAAVVWTLVVLAWSRIPVVSSAVRGSRATSVLIAPQALRVAGVIFLLAAMAGALPWLFALPAGLGDIAIGIATPSVMRAVARGGLRRAVWFNILGLLDLMVAFTLGALTGLSAATQLIPVSPTSAALTMLPLVLIVTSAVPLAMALHILDFAALRRMRRAASDRPAGASLSRA